MPSPDELPQPVGQRVGPRRESNNFKTTHDYFYMELNLSELLRPLQQVRQEPLTIEGRSYLTLALPAPYNLNVQISLQNYKSEIEYICKRKNVPKELQEFIVKNFERNATATGDPISSVKHTTIETSDAKKQLSTITNTNLRTTFKQPV
jgi:hypothetical protein